MFWERLDCESRTSDAPKPDAERRSPKPVVSLQYRGDEKLVCSFVVLDAQHVGLAAYLAVFDVALASARGFIHRSRVPLPTAGALKNGFHE